MTFSHELDSSFLIKDRGAGKDGDVKKIKPPNRFPQSKLHTLDYLSSFYW